MTTGRPRRGTPRRVAHATDREIREGLVDLAAPWRWADTEEARDHVEELIDLRTEIAVVDTHDMHSRLNAIEGMTSERLRYFPGDRELPEGGAWVTVLRPPHTALVGRFDLRFGMTFWATPYADGVQGWRDRVYSVTIRTPGGDLRLFPYEYCRAPLDAIVEAWANGEAEFHPLDVDEEDLAPRLFYLHSRGIPTSVALPMALGTGEITGPVGWFEVAL